MSDFITLACPSCAGNLKITSDSDRFVCKYCNREHLVRRQGGIVTVAPVIEKLDRIVSGVDRHASELAIVRLKNECREVEEEIEAVKGNYRTMDARSETKLRTAVVWSIVIAAIGLIASLNLGASNSSAALGVILIVGLTCTRWIYTANVDRQEAHRSISLAKAQIPPLEETLARCSSELSQHNQNVRI